VSCLSSPPQLLPRLQVSCLSLSRARASGARRNASALIFLGCLMLVVVAQLYDRGEIDIFESKTKLASCLREMCVPC
jgi:hypothetical protein